MLCQLWIDRLGGRGWTERKRRKPRGFGLRPPAPATPHSKFDKALVVDFLFCCAHFASGAGDRTLRLGRVVLREAESETRINAEQCARVN